MKLQGLVFDMDGTLFDTERLALVAWKETLIKTGEVFPDGFVNSIIGVNSVTARTLATTALGCRERTEAFFRAFGVIYQAHLKEAGVPLKPGAQEILEWAASQGLSLGLATSTSRDRAIAKLDQAGFTRFFDAIVCGDEVSKGKPAPDIFRAAVAAMAVHPSRVIALEDSPNGLRASSAAGLRTVLIPDLAPFSHDLLALAWVVVPDLFAAREKIQAFLLEE